MRVLAVDTSGSVAAVAVMDEHGLAGEYILNNGKTHSQRLMPMVDELLKALELKPVDIDLFAASKGPGSFTGLRIGISTVKAMAYSLGRPAIGIFTLDALAANICCFDGLVCPIMDARNKQVYTSVYEIVGQKPVSLTGVLGIPVEELTATILKYNKKVMFLGDAARLHKEYLQEKLGDLCEFAPEHLMLQKASSVAMLALRGAAGRAVGNSFDIAPFYLRKSQAEREYERKQA